MVIKLDKMNYSLKVSDFSLSVAFPERLSLMKTVESRKLQLQFTKTETLLAKIYFFIMLIVLTAQ